MAQFDDPILAGTVLVRDAIQSEDYAPGVSGWRIGRDGSAEFNDIDIRNGTAQGGVALYYDGTPAAGNLFLSIAAADGVDQFGNAYPAGLGMFAGGMLSAQITPDSLGITGPSFVSHGTQSPTPILAALGGGEVVFQPDDPGITLFVAPRLYGTYNAATGQTSIRMRGGAPTVGSTEPEIQVNSSSTTDVANVNYVTEAGAQVDIRNNGVSQPRGLVKAVAQPATVSGFTAETEIINSGTVTFRANRAYEVIACGFAGSTVAGDIAGFQLHKTNAAGTKIHDWLDAVICQLAGRNGYFIGRKVMTVGAANITTALSLTASRRNGTGTITCNDSGTQDPYLEIRDIGSASDYPGFFVLT